MTGPGADCQLPLPTGNGRFTPPKLPRAQLKQTVWKHCLPRRRLISQLQTL